MSLLARGTWAGLLLMLAAQIIAPPPAVAAGGLQDPAAVTTAIRQAVAATAPGNATITLGPATGAQYMKACTGPLGVTISGVEPYEQAAVHCAALGWTLYVTVTVAANEAVVVAARPITAGESVQAADLALRQEPVSLFAGRQVFYHPDELEGATAVMNLPAGAILTTSAIAEPVIVHAGQMVTVRVNSGDVELSVNATADQAGRAGDMILMTNASTGQRFQALVTRTGPVVQLQ